MRKHAVTVALLSLFVSFHLGLARVQAATYYISSSLGNDANTTAQAQSKATPWAHLPGMPSARGACAAFTPLAGDSFILRGGDTWTAADLGVDWGWSGTSAARIYIGVNQTWFKGSSWSRPIFNCGNAPCAGPQRLQMWIYGAYVTVDNIEFTGLRQVGGCVGNVSVYSDHDEVMNCYFHGWSRAAGETDNGTSFALSANASMGEARVAGSSFHDNVIDGSDTTRDMWGGIFFGEHVHNNVIRYVVSAMLGDFTYVHGNLMEHNVYSYAGDHANLMFIFGPFNDSTRVYAYNNVVRHNRLAPGSMGFWINGNSGGNAEWVSYAFNNVIYDVDNGVMALGSHPYSGNTGTYYVFNNTIDGNGGYAMGNGESPPRSVTHFANNHCVNSSAFVCTTGTTAINDGGNLLQSMAQANASGYTASQSYAYSPTSAASPTVAAGVNLSAWCTGELAAMASDTSYPTYDEVNHRVVMRTVAARPTVGAWNIGAYQFAESSTPPAIASQPVSRAVYAGQTATFAVTATGTAPLSYQWQKNGTNISAATSSAHTTPATLAADSGSTFRCVVTNALGSATSNAATLTVNVPNLPPTVISSATATPNPAVAGQSVSLTAAGSDPEGAVLTYTWDFGDGTTTVQGSSVNHTYGVGSFTATVSVSDGVNAPVASSVVVVVNSAGTNTVTVTKAGSPLAGVYVYAYDAASTYLGKYALTNAQGKATFRTLASGLSVKYRVTNEGAYFWSPVITSPQDTAISIPAITTVTVQKGGLPLSSAYIYAFDTVGNYLNYYRLSDANGRASFAIASGTQVKFRVTNQGAYFWSSVATAPASPTIALPANTTVTVQKAGAPLTGAYVYAFDAAGTYLNYARLTDASGKVVFALTTGRQVKFRVSNQGAYYWSGVITAPGTASVSVPADTTVTVLRGTAPLAGVYVYAYNSAGVALGYTRKTNAGGQAFFALAALQQVKFRVVSNSQAYWSALITAPSTASINAPAGAAGAGAMAPPAAETPLETEMSGPVSLGTFSVNQSFKVSLQLPAGLPQITRLRAKASGLPTGARVRGTVLRGKIKKAGTYVFTVQFTDRKARLQDEAQYAIDVVQ